MLYTERGTVVQRQLNCLIFAHCAELAYSKLAGPFKAPDCLSQTLWPFADFLCSAVSVLVLVLVLVNLKKVLLVICGRLSWLPASFWAHNNVVLSYVVVENLVGEMLADRDAHGDVDHQRCGCLDPVVSRRRRCRLGYLRSRLLRMLLLCRFLPTRKQRRRSSLRSLHFSAWRCASATCANGVTSAMQQFCLSVTPGHLVLLISHHSHWPHYLRMFFSLLVH